MIYLNLLPKKYISDRRKKALLGLVIRLEKYILVLLVVEAILLSFYYSTIQSEIESDRKAFENFQKEQNRLQFEDELTGRIYDLNASIKTVLSVKRNIRKSPLEVFEVFSKDFPDVRKEQILFRSDDGKFTISGSARTREAYLQYVRAIRDELSFYTVEAPLKNLEKSEDLHFEVTVYYKNTTETRGK